MHLGFGEVDKASGIELVRQHLNDLAERRFAREQFIKTRRPAAKFTGIAMMI